MKRIFYITTALIATFSLSAQSNKTIEPTVFKVKKDSLEYELKSGKLSWLNDESYIGWTHEVFVKNNYVGDLAVKNDSTFKWELLRLEKGQTYEMKKLKQMRPNKTIHYIEYRQIVVE